MSNMKANIERWCYEEAERECCQLQPVNGLFVRIGRDADSYEVAFCTTGQRGKQYSWFHVDAPPSGTEDKYEEFVRMHAQRACELLRAVAMVPADVPIITRGSPCPEHPDRCIVAISRAEWMYRCEVEDHAIPERACLGRFIERRKS